MDCGVDTNTASVSCGGETHLRAKGGTLVGQDLELGATAIDIVLSTGKVVVCRSGMTLVVLCSVLC